MKLPMLQTMVYISVTMITILHPYSLAPFFQKEIQVSFSDVTYHYKAKKFDVYAYEVWLEFKIEDTEAFSEFISEATAHADCETFLYDDSYMECTISDYIELSTEYEGVPYTAENGYPIGYAEIGKILYSVNDQKIIFWALGTYDGGGTNTVELNHFFSYFDIDPAEYAKNADTSYLHQTPNN